MLTFFERICCYVNAGCGVWIVFKSKILRWISWIEIDKSKIILKRRYISCIEWSFKMRRTVSSSDSALILKDKIAGSMRSTSS